MSRLTCKSGIVKLCLIVLTLSAIGIISWKNHLVDYIRRGINYMHIIPKSEKLANAERCFAKIKSQIGVDFSKTSQSIRIVKHKRTLKLYSDEKLIKIYKIVLGRVPTGKKEKEGDIKTPEGEYYICTRNENSKNYLFLGISYPNIEDAKLGLSNGLISQDDYKKIEGSIKKRKHPPWNTKLGGEIGIHGGGVDSDWTSGCIGLENDDIAELWFILPLGSLVTILP